MTQGLFGDDPLDDDSEDALDRGDYASHVADVIRRVRAQGATSSVLAVVGPWGGGKSTILGMIRRRLEKTEDGWIINDFTPWLYPDVDTMQAAFFRELHHALPKGEKWKYTGETIENLGAAISPFGKFTTLLGVDSSEMIKAFSKTISGDTSVNATKDKADAALLAADRPILIVIDDLDRLSPDELLMAFKLVRFVGRLPNVYYLLSYDERTLIDVIMQTDLASGDTRRAQDYMEKMVQVRLDLPALRDSQATSLVNEAMETILTRNRVTLDGEQVRRIGSAYEAMDERLNTPRSIRRFFAQIDAFYRPELAEEIDFVDFLCVTWIRTFEPQAYRFILQNRGPLTQRKIHQDEATDLKSVWAGRLRSARVAEGHVDAVLQLLELLFAPAFQENALSQHATVTEELHLRKSVAHPDYFDRYFAFAVPSEDVPDSTVLRAFDSSHPEHSLALEVMLERLMKDTARVSRKIRSFLQRNLVSPRLVLAVACAITDRLPKGRGIVDNPRVNLEFVTRDALVKIPENEGRDLLLELAKSPTIISLLAWEVARLTKPSHGANDASSRFEWSDIAVETMAGLIKNEFERGSWQSPRDVPEEVFRLLTPWRLLAFEECRAFIASKIPAWGLLETLMALVPESILYGVDGPIRKLNAFQIEDLSAYVDVTEALADLAAEIAAMDPDSNVSGQWTIEPTDDNRKALVLEALRAEAERTEARRRASESTDDLES